jgi:serine protease Do
LKGYAVPVGTAAALIIATSFFLFGHDTTAMAATTAATQPQLTQSEMAPLNTLDNSIEDVVSHVMPAVVNISVTARIKSKPSSENGQGSFGGIPPQDLPPGFRHFFFFGPGNGQGQQQKPQYEYGIGSGFIISPDGYIVTNHHVVKGATSIHVTLHDHRMFTAKVVGVDKLDDLAVIKINATNLPTVKWGDSSKLRQGQTVLAFGSPFGSLHFSVTRGIVSADHRAVRVSNNARAPEDYIQTDAAINPGNSGGPLVDSHGDVIGIDTFIYTNTDTFAGAGFAIPSDLAEHYVNEIIKTGKVVHGYLGIGITDITPENASFFNVPTASGALVDQVNPGTPASSAGLQRGDVIRKINGHEVADITALQVMVSEMTPGTPLTLGILRNGKPLTLKATVGQYHPNNQHASNSSASGQHVHLGISVESITPQVRQELGIPTNVQGVAIQSVRAGSAADVAGLAPGFVIMEVDRHPVDSAQSFDSEMRSIPAGKNVLLLIWTKQGTIYRVVQPNQ